MFETNRENKQMHGCMDFWQHEWNGYVMCLPYNFCMKIDSALFISASICVPSQKCLVQVTFSPTLSDDVINAEALRWREEFHSDTSNCQHTEPDAKVRSITVSSTIMLLLTQHTALTSVVQ